MRPCASSKGYDELQTLISVQKSAGEMPHFVVMHLSSKILHSKEVCPLPSLRTCSFPDMLLCLVRGDYGSTVPPFCENHARKMRTFFTRRLEPKTKSSNAFKWSLRPKRK